MAARKQVTHTVTLLVVDDQEGEMAKAALDKYLLLGAGVVKLDRDLTKRDYVVTKATENFIKLK